jgi:hypothetical protein
MNIIFNKPCYNNTNTECNNDIYIFTQFYIPKEANRIKEVNDTLKNNINNKFVKKVVLLNERIYTTQELGLSDTSKIEQIVIKDRLTYTLFFYYASQCNYKGYLLLANSDIFFDETLENLYKTVLSTEKSCFTQLRFEYNKKLFGPRSDSQDSWLFHSNHLPSSHMMYNFQLGQPGCDNKITFWLFKNGYKIYNEPFRIKTYHMHMSEIRHYGGRDIIPGPYIHPVPLLSDNFYNKNLNNKQLNNQEFHDYIKNMVDNNTPFFIPKIGLYEHITVYKLMHSYKIQETFDNLLNKSKIKFDNDKSLKLYCTMYSETIINNKCIIDCNPEKYKNIKELQISRDINQYKYSYCEDLINHEKYANSLNSSNSSNFSNSYFTHALKDKHILIICDYTNNFKNKLKKNVFNNCTFSYLYFKVDERIPWFTNFISLCKEVKKLLDNNNETKFDIALCDCYGLSNLIAHHIYTKHKRSAISLQDSLKGYAAKGHAAL